MYREQYCDGCYHDVNQDCKIWLVHLAYNYGQKEKTREIMDILIPPDGIYNAECSMYLPTMRVREVSDA